MRKLPIALFLAVWVIMAFAAPCQAKDKKDNAATKLAWGVVNLLMAPVELVKGVTTEPYDKGPAYDLPVGFWKGFSNMGRRLGAGTYEAATFPVPVPKGYVPVLKEDRKEEGGEKKEEAIKEKEEVKKEEAREEAREEAKEELEKEIKEEAKEEGMEEKLEEKK